MEPAVQYAQTADGSSIAYWTLGAGRPLVLTPAWEIAGSTRTWQTPNGRAWLEKLAERRKIVRFDYRGFGLSQQESAEITLESHLADLDAVIEAVGGGPVDVFGYMASVPVSIAYAAEHPDAVSALVLWCGIAHGIPAESTATQRALDMLLEADWELYTEALAASVLRQVGQMDSAQYAASLRESVTPTMARAFNARPQIDAESLLPRVPVPTLVLHRRGVQRPPLTDVRAMAARIPGARLAILDGPSSIPYVGDVDALIEAINDFLSAPPDPAGDAVEAGLLTILFTDLVSSTALTRQLGDARAQELIRTHNTIVRDALRVHRGREIKHTGDGIMASFATASGAIEAAIAIQRGFAQEAFGEVAVHVGLNAGEPVAEDRDLFGTSVQMARRICDHATAGQIVVANVVRELSAGKGFLFSDLGDVVPKGFEEPVRLYEVRWQGEA